MIVGHTFLSFLPKGFPSLILPFEIKAVFTKNTPASQGALADLVSSLIGRKLSIVAITANDAGQ
jgi:hypothetical protein